MVNGRAALMAGIAKQLGHPHGLRGRIVGGLLNRGNRGFVQAAVDAVRPNAGAVVADVGFGGGVGLKFLLDSVGQSGRVHGVEVSETMLSSAARQYRRAIAGGQLTLHSGSLTQLPFPEGALDNIITVNTIYFIAELERAFTELDRVTRPAGRIVVGMGDPDAMARMPFTGHGFHLRPVPVVISALRAAGFAVEHRRISENDGAPHLLIATPRR
jgi:SAM-dependent methyltransferase